MNDRDCVVSSSFSGCGFSTLRRMGLVVCAAGAFAALAVAGGCQQGVRAGAKPAAPASLAERSARFVINDANWSELGYRRDWTAFPRVAPGAYIQHFEAFSDSVFVQDSTSIVTAVKASSGENLWALEMSDPLRRFVGLSRDGDRLFVSSEPELFVLAVGSGEFYEDPQRDFPASQRMEFVVNTKPLLMGNLAIYGSTSGEVIGHRTNVALNRWRYRMDSAINFSPVVVGQSNTGPIIGVVAESGQFVFLDAFSGQYQVSGTLLDGIDTQPIAAGGLMIVAGRDQSLWGLRPDGSVAWRVRTSHKLVDPPISDGSTVWVNLGEFGISAVRVSSGVVQWSAKNAAGEPVHGRVVAVHGDQLLCVDGKRVFTLDATRGDVIASFEVPGLMEIRTEKLSSGPIYLLSEGGLIVRMNPR